MLKMLSLLLMDTILPYCKAQSKWRSCSQLETIKTNYEWWWNSFKETKITKNIFGILFHFVQFYWRLTVRILYHSSLA